MNERALAERESYLDRLEERLPKCEYCGETIADVYAYDIMGDICCEECAKEWLKSCQISVERLMDE